MDFLSSLIQSFAPAAPQPEIPEEDYEGPGGQICPACQRVSPPAQALCSFCRAPLAFLTEAAPESEELVLIPDFYQPLFKACHAVAEKKITPEEWSLQWESVVQRLEEMAEDIDRNVQKLPARVPQRQHILDLATQVLAGIEKALQGLDTMALFLENEHPECLNRGWMQLVAATGGIQRAAAQLAASRP
ncbi:MAG: hypothetical protein KF760_26265 [Candidatus Eremiobacteraeota bacterium]|nr:hypothetical protein [Candidatus Eremiobacteraeota bacterium]MCW5869546.1 hypothetical protein [Candidatus Eremiobacteraeota bacterium]